MQQFRVKQTRAMEARRKREVMSKLEIFSFNSALQQQTNILWRFSSLKIKNGLFSNKFFRCISRSERKVYTAENNQLKYFVQNELVKITFLFAQTTSWLCCYCHKLRFFKLLEAFKGLFRKLHVLDLY